MLKDISETLKDYGIVGFVMSVMTLIIRPFISVRQVIRDCTITFIFSMLGGLLLEYVDIPFTVKCGLSGVCGLFAVNLYIVLEQVFNHLAENPEKVVHHFLRKKDSKNDSKGLE